MRVVLLAIPAEARTGFGRYASGLAAGLEEIGVDVEIWPVPKTELSVAGRRFLGDTLTRLRLRTTHRPRDDGAIVHATHQMLAAPQADVVTLHDLIPFKQEPRGWRDRVHRRHITASLRRLDGKELVVPTQHVAGDVERLGLTPSHVTVTYEGIDTDTFHASRPHPGMEASGFHVLLVGDLSRRKRWDLVLQAAQDLDDVHVWHAGTFVGDPPPGYAEFASRLGDRYHKLVRVDDATLRSLYSGCDLFALPTLDEGFGLPPLEAMACGARVLVSDIPVLHEVLGTHAEYTRLEPAEVAAALQRARAQDAPTGRDARIAHARGYTWAAAAERTVRCYERVLG